METGSIYLDNAATTMTDPRVVEAMLPYFTESYAVASSEFSHSPGQRAREGLENARAILAAKIHAHPEEIIFTSGGTESNNLALKGTAQSFRGKKDHIICSAVEHNSVIHTCQWLEQEGFRTTLLPVDGEGFMELERISSAVTDRTFLVSIQHGNQEVGTLQDIAAIGALCREKGVLFHSDASQSLISADLTVDSMQADLLTFSAHKIHGPKGVGALYVRKNTPIKKWAHGGYSEFDLRPGTENVAGIVGFGKAVEIADPKDTEKIRFLQKSLIQNLTKEIDGVFLNGPADLSRRLPGNVNVSFDLIEGESVVLHLDMKGIAAITGSACFSRSLEPSYVMMAMGFSHERAHGSIRFSLSRFSTQDEIRQTVAVCRETVQSLRSISPMKKKE